MSHTQGLRLDSLDLVVCTHLPELPRSQRLRTTCVVPRFLLVGVWEPLGRGAAAQGLQEATVRALAGAVRISRPTGRLPHELAAGLGPFQPLAETSVALRVGVSLESPQHGHWPPCRQGAGGENAPESPPGRSHSSHNSAWKEQPMAPMASSALCLLEASHPPEPLPRGQESHKDMIPRAQDRWGHLRGCPPEPRPGTGGHSSAHSCGEGG